jgi:hypothetical protein
MTQTRPEAQERKMVTFSVCDCANVLIQTERVMLSKEKEKVEPTTIAQEIVANGTPVGISPNKCQN